jgi:hypothetical protein
MLTEEVARLKTFVETAVSLLWRVITVVILIAWSSQRELL